MQLSCATADSVFKIKTMIIVTVFCFFFALLPTFSPTFPSQLTVEVFIRRFLRLFFLAFAQNLCIFHFSFSLISHVMMDRKSPNFGEEKIVFF